jgi:hypothetical protein
MEQPYQWTDIADLLTYSWLSKTSREHPKVNVIIRDDSLPGSQM